MAKKFISFLGTGNYQECIYQLNEVEGKTVVYIQDDLIDRFCSEYTEEDKILIFLTKEAREKHWENKLCTILEEKKLSCQLCPIDITDNKSVSDIWGLFEQIHNVIEENDEIIFDLTHSFRYLPMLFFSILHYSTFTKNISVEGIYYGAWEARKDNIAPIFDLTDSFRIMQWANATDVYLSYGEADKIEKCVRTTAKDFIGSSSLSKNILAITEDIKCSRLKSIVKSDKIQKVKKSISELEINLQPAFKPIISKISKKIENFETDSTLNFIPAVKWCIDHKMVSQGITLLQEGALSYIIDKNGFDYSNKDLRECISDRLGYDKTDEYTPRLNEEEYKSQIEKIFNDNFTKEYRNIYQSIRQLRNDINHAGINEQSTESTDRLFNQLKKQFENVKNLINFNND